MKKPTDFIGRLFGDRKTPTYLSLVSDGIDLVRFKECYAGDDIAAIAVLEIDYDFQWGSSGQPKTGCGVAVVFLNRTEEFIHLGIGGNTTMVMVDDSGNQYSPISDDLHWVDKDESQPDPATFMIHDGSIAPQAKLEGFFLFPKLRAGAERFSHLFLHGQLNVGDEWIKIKYRVDISE
jgi:hypothetical protein